MQYNSQSNQYGNNSNQQINQDYPQYPKQYPEQTQYANLPQQPYLDSNVPFGQPPFQGYQGNQLNSNVQQQHYIVNGPIEISAPISVSAEGKKFPIQIKCQFCQQIGLTKIEKRVGDGTICASFLILFLCFPLFWLPCCLDDCKDRIHLCQNCGKIAGSTKYELC